MLQLSQNLVFILVLIFAGEALAILAEILSARGEVRNSKKMLRLAVSMTLVIIFGGAVSIYGYMLGISLLSNIWIITVASIASILIIEPVLDYALLKQLPTRGAVLGFLLGASGMIIAILVK